MKCPECLNDRSRVKDCRPECDYIWRIRVCEHCGYKWRTVEIDEDLYNSLAGVKKKKGKK